MAKVKILFIIDKMVIGGCQQHLLHLLAGLDRESFEPQVCCIMQKELLSEKLEAMGIKVFELGVKRIYGLSGIRALLKLAAFLKQEKITILHSYLFSATLLGNLAAKLAGVPIVIAGRRDTGVHREGKWQHHLAYRLVYNQLTDKIIAVSNAVKATIVKEEKVPAQKIATVYNGVDFEKCNPVIDRDELKQSLGIKPEERVVGIIGSLSPVKGHKLFLKAASQVLNALAQSRFLIIGSGPLEAELKQLCRELAIESRVLFLGRRTDIAQLLSIMEVSVNASKSEGMSNTILESMAAGVPVVATAVDGNLETVMEGKTGFLVSPEDEKQMAEAILKILTNPQLRQELQENSRKIAKEKFTLTAMVQETQKVYRQLLKERL